MLWLIQRDFLKGASAEVMLHESLAPVPNPQHQEDITNVRFSTHERAFTCKRAVCLSLSAFHSTLYPGICPFS